MLVTIVQVNSKTPDGFLVYFSCQHGEGYAYWYGDKPNINGSYHVELEIPEVLKWTEEITLNFGNQNMISYEDNVISLTGQLKSIAEDGVSIVRLGDDIIMLSTTGTPFPIGSYVRVKTKKIVLYDTGI